MSGVNIPLAVGNLQPPSCEFTFRVPGQIGSTESVSTPTLTLDRSQVQHLPVQIDPHIPQQHLPAQVDPQLSPHLLVQIDPQLSPQIQLLEAELEPVLRSRGPRLQAPSTVDSGPLSPPASTAAPASPPARHHLRLPPHSCPPTSNEPSTIPESQAEIARADDIVNRGIRARKINAHTRTE